MFAKPVCSNRTNPSQKLFTAETHFPSKGSSGCSEFEEAPYWVKNIAEEIVSSLESHSL